MSASSYDWINLNKCFWNVSFEYPQHMFHLRNKKINSSFISEIRKLDSKCSKSLNTSCLPKWLRQTVQTQIRLLLMKQSDPGLLCLLSWQAFCELQPWKNQRFIWEQKEKKSVQNFRTFTVYHLTFFSLCLDTRLATVWNSIVWRNKININLQS